MARQQAAKPDEARTPMLASTSGNGVGTGTGVAAGGFNNAGSGGSSGEAGSTHAEVGVSRLSFI
jgi:hypothetical protein